MGVSKRFIWLVLAGVCAVGLAAAAGSAASVRTYATRWTPPLATGMFDPFTMNGSDYALAMTDTRKVGASYVRIEVPWSQVAPAAPPANSAGDPAWYGYQWGWLDSKVAAAVQNRLIPYLQIGSAPSWAVAKGTTPKVADLRNFATALAGHYDGNHGAPAVHIFQVWNEPNLSLDLSPVKPATYRSMVNGVSAAVKAVDKSNLVVAGALDPFSNKTKNWHAEAPLTYMRALLCVSGGKKPHGTCRSQIHFDIWAHHPYTFGGPFAKARRPDDVSLGNLPTMDSVLKLAKRLHRVVSAKAPQFWVTEFAWGTSPPRRGAAPLALADRWTSESLYQMWRSGVTLATWFVIEDQPKPSPYATGLYYHAKSLAHARAKPVRTAFRFPFVAYLGHGKVSVWGRDATSNKRLVAIQLRKGTRGHWRTVARIRSNAAGIFLAKLRLGATKNEWLRATAAGSGSSLPFSLKRPSPRLRYGPWGN